MPADDAHYSARWKAIKIAFAKALPRTEWRSPVRAAKGERGIWQRRFWEHTIRHEQDYAAHVDYVHINPVKQADWPCSSFHRRVVQGVYFPGLGRGGRC